MLQNRSEKFAVMVSLLAIIANISFVARSHTLTSGFYFMRLYRYIMFQNNVPFPFGDGGALTFPMAPPLLISLSKVTGLQLLDVSFLPIIPFFTFFGYLIFARRILPSGAAYTGSAAITLNLYGTTGHIFEYALGKMLFPVFAFVTYLAWKNTKQKRIKGYNISQRNLLIIFVLLPLMLSIKGFSPHAELWVGSFIIILTIVLKIRQKFTNQYDSFIQSAAYLAILYIVSLFTFNPKFYFQLSSRVVSGIEPIVALGLFLTRVIGGISKESKFYAAVNSPPISKAANTVYMGITILFCIIAIVGIVRRVQFQETPLKDILQDRDILIVAAFLSIFPDVVMQTMIGRPNLQVVTVIGPLLAIYMWYRWRQQSGKFQVNNLRRVTLSVATILLVFAIISQVAFLSAGALRSINEDEMAATTLWVDSHRDEIDVLSGLHTWSYGRTVLADHKRNPREYDLTRYTTQNYGYVVGENNLPETHLDIVFVNWETGNRPIQRGWPDWQYFDPPNQYKEQIRGNTNLNKVYFSGGYAIYVPEKELIDNKTEPNWM